MSTDRDFAGRKWQKYVAEIADGLDRAYSGPRTLHTTWDIATARVVVFSDHHKGARNRADDFRGSERAYLAALDYYFANGFTLVTLGDVEEMWEERHEAIHRSYPAVYASEARFVAAGRYLRVWGNHDDDWMKPDQVDAHLARYLGGPLVVHEAIRATLVDGPLTVGSLFLVHGHQGTSASDKHSGFSRFVVRNLWRPVQRVTNFSWNTPSKDEVLRERHDTAMYLWASEHPDDPILIAGHTHRPVFLSATLLASMKADLARLYTARDAASPADRPPIRMKINELLAKIAQAEQDPREYLKLTTVVPLSKPCYINTGGCCFTDRRITGLEIANGVFRHVRWSDGMRSPDERGASITIAHAYAKLLDSAQW